MIYTSYFSNLKNIKTANYIVASICLYRPSWLPDTVENWTVLTPPLSLLRGYKVGKISKEQYTEIYLNKLNENKSRLLEEFRSIKEDIIMLCYEKPTDFCHRHVLADWLIENGIECREYNNGGINHV